MKPATSAIIGVWGSWHESKRAAVGQGSEAINARDPAVRQGGAW